MNGAIFELTMENFNRLISEIKSNAYTKMLICIGNIILKYVQATILFVCNIGNGSYSIQKNQYIGS